MNIDVAFNLQQILFVLCCIYFAVFCGYLLFADSTLDFVFIYFFPPPGVAPGMHQQGHGYGPPPGQQSYPHPQGHFPPQGHYPPGPAPQNYPLYGIPTSHPGMSIPRLGQPSMASSPRPGGVIQHPGMAHSPAPGAGALVPMAHPHTPSHMERANPALDRGITLILLRACLFHL